ncbi:unnamed protein product [Microthlaspi erraticum]|uniref:SnoaL-like domain-containing protein n=1 Tax=Microthlaspi erraticum TaxID=1685480 RepID=A0A6D2K1G2_9BRAS|nr:unnamed protein product [Microthlaspi erraticum]CAA7057417.1 unnamed protein product [Microthlaspi erraticum]
MAIAQTFSSKLCPGINSFSICSDYRNNFHVLSTSRNGSVNHSIRLDQLQSNLKTLKHQIRARRLGKEWEEKEEDNKEEEDYRSEESDEEDHRSEQDNEEDDRAEEAVLKLYTDIKDRNIDGISEVIGDECQCYCNFLSTYRLLQGKKKVMAFFYWLIMKLGKDIKIVVRPTSKDGMTVGVQWQLEWEKQHIQLGKGVSFHICHIYQGKLLIKNVEMFMEPIFHIEPLRLRTMAFAVNLAEKIVTFLKPARRQAMTVLLFTVLLLAAVAFYFTQPRL